jgi:hypothetical protein
MVQFLIMTNPAPMPVICDRCREHGLVGADPFAAFGALLDFEPVPRRKTRADGWDAEVQRAFVAALSLTGSRRAAARAVGRAAFGAEQLLGCPGSEGFRAACEDAMEIAADERSRRLAEGLRTVAAEQSGWRPPDPPWAKAASRRRPPPAPTPPEPEDSEETKLRLLEKIVLKYMLKVGQEREARLAGKIVAADFYLRQLTWIEVAADLMSGNGFQVLQDFRAGDHHLISIAETPFSRLLGDARREKWARLGEPPRPGHPPRRYLVDHGRFSTEPLEVTSGGLELSHDQQRAVFEERHRQDAEAQLNWEEAARQDYEARSAASKADDA